MKINNKGFGLVEVMITLGIMSVVMLGLMQLTTHAMMVSQTADQKQNVTSISGSTTGIALNNFTCTAAITKEEVKFGGPVVFGELKAGYSIPSYNLTVTAITYDKPVLQATGYEGTKIYYGNLLLSLKSNRTVLGGEGYAPRPIAMIYVTVNPAGKIISCGAAMPTLPPEPTPPEREPSAIKTLAFDADPKVCENFPVKAKCSDSQKITVTESSYGKNCAGVPADYGKQTVQALCDGQSSCAFTAGNINNCTTQGVFIDPAVNCPKSFHMAYYCK